MLSDVLISIGVVVVAILLPGYIYIVSKAASAGRTAGLLALFRKEGLLDEEKRKEEKQVRRQGRE